VSSQRKPGDGSQIVQESPSWPRLSHHMTESPASFPFAACRYHVPGVLIRHASSVRFCQAYGPCCQLRWYKSFPTSPFAQKIFWIRYLSARALRTSVRIRPRLRFC